MLDVNPKISIVVPVYKSESYLKQSIDSLINQTYTEIEIILINDGSPDNSGAICDQYAAKDKRIKVIHKENGGAADALNVGTSFATGIYLMYLDADDWIAPETCELAINCAEKNNSDIVIWSYFNEFQNKTTKAKTEFDCEMIFENEDLTNLCCRMVGLTGRQLQFPTRTDSINAGWAKLYRKTLFDVNTNYWINSDIIGSSDVFFNIQIFRKAQKVVYLNQHYNHYRRSNPNSLTANYKNTLLQKYLMLFKLIENFIIENKLGQDYNIALNNRIALSTINNVLSIVSVSNNTEKRKKISHIKTILNHPAYRPAISKLQSKYLPFHWKVFFCCVKLKSAFWVYYLGILMQKMR